VKGLPDAVNVLLRWQVWDRMGYSSTPAQMVHDLIVSKIQGFQAGVVRRQAASTLDHRCCFLCCRCFLRCFSGAARSRALACP
jgi:hypothetical protein